MIPEDGFDEDEDCVNVEDESYRDYLNSITSGDKLNHMVYRDGELVSINEHGACQSRFYM